MSFTTRTAALRPGTPPSGVQRVCDCRYRRHHVAYRHEAPDILPVPPALHEVRRNTMVKTMLSNLGMNFNICMIENTRKIYDLK